MKTLIAIMIFFTSVGVNGQELQIAHVSKDVLVNAGVSSVTRFSIRIEDCTDKDTTRTEVYALDSLYRIVKISRIQPTDKLRQETYYEYDSIGVTNVRIRENGTEISSKFYDPKSSTDCFCPKTLDFGADRFYHANGLLRREDISDTRYEYVYEFLNKN